MTFSSTYASHPLLNKSWGSRKWYQVPRFPPLPQYIFIYIYIFLDLFVNFRNGFRLHRWAWGWMFVWCTKDSFISISQRFNTLFTLTGLIYLTNGLCAARKPIFILFHYIFWLITIVTELIGVLAFHFWLCHSLVNYSGADMNINMLPMLKRIIQNKTSVWIFR